MMDSLRLWFKSGLPYVWLNAAAVSVSILLVIGLLGLIAARGLGHFWPATVYEVTYLELDGSRRVFAAQVRKRERVKASQLTESGIDVEDGVETVERILLKTGNRDLTGEDFRWILQPRIEKKEPALSMAVLERAEWGVFFGRVVGLKQQGDVLESQDVWGDFQSLLERTDQLRDQIRELEKGAIGSVNYRLERLRLAERKLELRGVDDPVAYADIEAERAGLDAEYRALEDELLALNEAIRRDAVILQTSGGQEVELSLHTIVDAWMPNAMNVFQRLGHYFGKGWSFLVDDPREANTEGGIFPAIYGTILMVLVMTVVVTPFGVVAGVYLKEYAHQGLLTRIIRIAVNNLAGVPSIVYGVFGLGFFIYTLGSGIDKLFFEAALPAPTFGTGGLFWASLTLALLTLPVVIVSTEEGLARIPRSIREGSLALGATQWETLWRTVLPMASPGIMTGLILAVARAAGEVAPLMLVGVVKLAPSLPLDGNYPFLHPERKFMHLGFHIYDVGFQSPNVEAARPLVYATALLLVVVILLLNMVAIHVRNGLREKYKGIET
ncbi:MAG: phosphate ABC transporter permease PstA [Xanthomonadales bacterium]|nr:phosphate ABC transporter permease PstA [Gammaproteobacteria bacterium]MBT8065441.1 phosphate ABC transporter permease PstA [Gammaproteobacteria bacterium]NNK32815.1 phosphate ABC transporter permease PstA [Xanthomonadales bacterium]NNK37642.1 phosphate ABC transporter permease PstA [Xanthomonadales bacterium]